MNKKLLMGALVVFGLGTTFTSCVDDTESASVTAIRQAKAEQLKAKADLDKANAEAAITLANAEAAIKQADAAYKQALADYQKSLAAYQEAQTESLKQKLAIELEQMQAQLDLAKANLQRTLAQAEADIARYKYEALDYTQKYDKLLANADKQQNQEIANLLDAYKTAAETLIDAKRNLARETASLASLEAGLASLPETVQGEITALEEENAEKAIEIDGKNALIAAYEKYAGTEVTEEDIQAAHIKYIEAQEAYKAAREASNEANIALNNANNDLNLYYSYIWNNWLNNSKRLNYGVWNETTERTDWVSVNIEWVNSSNVPATARNKYCVVLNEWNNGTDIYTYLPLFEGNKSTQNEIKYELSSGNYQVSYATYDTYYNLIDGGKAIETIIEHKEKQLSLQSNPEYLESLKKQLPELEKAQAEAQKAFDDAVKDYAAKVAAAEASYAKYQELNNAATAAWDAYHNNTDADKASDLLTAAQDASTKRDEAWDKYDEDNNAKNEAYNVKQNALNELDNATMAVYNTNQNINNQEYYKEQLATQITELKAAYAELVEEGKANDANIKIFNESKTEYYTDVVAVYKANDAQSIAWNEYNGMQLGVSGGNSMANQVIANAKSDIAALEQDIKDNEAEIEKLNKRLADIEAGTDNDAQIKQEQIDDMKAEIEKLTIAVETAQKKYDMAKSELDAALKTDSAE